MTPEVGLLGVTQYNWPSFRATMDKVLNLRPDIDINSLPVDFSDDALILLNVAAYFGWNIKNPLAVLRNMQPMFMEYLSYQFFIACNKETWEEFNPNNITTIKKDLPDGILLIIATGSLNAWYQTIVNNIARDWQFKHETRYLFDRIMLILERERGLTFIFENYKKKMQQDYTFLLEKK